MYGPAAGAAVGGILGQYKRENPGDPNQGMQMALRGGAAGIASNLASGQGAFLGKGARGAYGMEGEGSLNPLNIGKRILNMDSPGGGKGKGMDFFKGFKNPFSQKELTDTDLMNKIPADLRNQVPSNMTAIDKLRYDEALKTVRNSGGFAGMSAKEMLGYGLPATIAFAQLIKAGQPEGDDTPIAKNRTINDMIFEDDKSYDYRNYFAEGGVMDLQDGGESKGPGTGTSDSIPAMLSDGEFVMTAKAVRGAGGGDRREGARKMYEAMDQMEARA
jgi:hypothetical protein